MLHSILLLLLSIVAIVALTPEEEACIAPLSAKLEAETDASLKTTITTGLGLFTEGKQEEAKAMIKAMSDDKKARFRDFYLVDACSGFRPMYGLE